MKITKRAIKDAVKVPLDKLLNVHVRGDKPDVFIFSVGRSGSNWLMEIIHSQREFKYSNQPLWLPESTIYGRLLPPAPHGEYIHVEEADEQKLVGFFDLLLSGRIRVRPPWNVFSEDFSHRTSRYVVKVLHGASMINWFCERLRIRGILLLRHPIPRSMSMIQLNWPHSVDAFVNDACFVKRYLSREVLREVQGILAHGTQLEQHVLSWGLENLAALRSLCDRRWHCLTYEELVLNCEKVIEWLAAELDLSEPERMCRHIGLPSRASSTELRGLLDGERPTLLRRMDLLQRWRRQVQREEERSVFGILDLLQIDVYSCGSLFARSDLFNCSNTEELIHSISDEASADASPVAAR